MKYHEIARVQSQVNTGEDIYLLTLKSPEIARTAQPGQFVHLRTTSGSDPLLRRPISICLTKPEEGIIYLWYQVVGRGTTLLSQLKADDNVDLIGPLGRGFTCLLYTSFSNESYRRSDGFGAELLRCFVKVNPLFGNGLHWSVSAGDEKVQLKGAFC